MKAQIKLQHLVLFGALIACGFIYNNCSQVRFAQNSEADNGNGGLSTGPLIPGNPSTNPAPAPVTFNSIDQPATIAYNDNYPGPGDSDYNDFVVNIDAKETYDSNGVLTQIVVVYTPKYKISGIDHQFVLGFDGNIRGRNGQVSNLAKTVTQEMFEGSANIDYMLVDGNNAVLAHETNHSKQQDLVVFPSTGNSISGKQVATITITKLDPSTNTKTSRGGISIKRYRSVINNGGYDIDISDIDPKFLDQGGAPVAFFVPVNWQPPKESQSIFPAYPKFKAHAQYVMSGQALDSEPAATAQWYNDVGDSSLLLQ